MSRETGKKTTARQTEMFCFTFFVFSAGRSEEVFLDTRPWLLL